MKEESKNKPPDWPIDLSNHRKFISNEPLAVARLDWNSEMPVQNLVVFSYDVGESLVYNDSRPFAMIKNADLSYDLANIRQSSVVSTHRHARTDDGDLARVLQVKLQDLKLLSVHSGTTRFTALVVKDFYAYNPENPCILDAATSLEGDFESRGYPLQPPQVLFDAPIVPVIVSVYTSSPSAWADWFDSTYPNSPNG